MKQLLIAKANASLGATPLEIVSNSEGAVGVYALDDMSAWLESKATKNVAIVCGAESTENDDAKNYIIPEVDIDTLKATAIDYAAGTKFHATVTMPVTVEAGKNYTLVLVRKGTVFNERYQYTVTDFVPVGTTKTAAQLAKSLSDQLKAKVSGLDVPVVVTISGSQITVTAGDYTDWTLLGGDALHGVTVNITPAKKPIGDKAYVKHLASVCAAGKGFNYTDLEGRDLYPYYPETVAEDRYNLVHLRFAVGRDSAKQRDERVWQEVYIAVPQTDSTLYTKLKTIFGIEESSNDSNSNSNDNSESQT